jgi:hypothetical protein
MFGHRERETFLGDERIGFGFRVEICQESAETERVVGVGSRFVRAEDFGAKSERVHDVFVRSGSESERGDCETHGARDFVDETRRILRQRDRGTREVDERYRVEEERLLRGVVRGTNGDGERD